MVFNLNGGGLNTSLNLDGTPAAPINLMGPDTPTAGTDLTISASGTNVNITATNLNLLRSTAGLSMTLAGVETTSFTDTNITGSAIINHTGAGNTNFNLNTSAANPITSNTWGSLAITKGTGSDSQIITDTNFTGNVTITGSALASVTSGHGLLVALGTNVNVNQNLIAYTQSYPLTIQGNLAIAVAGSGSPDINLNDLTVATGATAITLGAEVNAVVQVQGTNFVSVYNTFTISSQSTVSGGGNNIYSLQDTAGTLEFNGAVKVTVGSTGNILELAADAAHLAGVTSAILDLFATTSFTGGAGTNVYYAGTHNTNLFYLTAPTI